MIDTHCHLYEDRLVEQLPDVLQRAAQSGVHRILAVATTAETSHLCVKLAEQHQEVFASIGVHPTYCHQEQPGDWDTILQWIDHPRVVALGETGLDNYWKECPLDLQEQSFDRHWEWSRRSGLPVIIHMRESTQQVIASARRAYQHGPLRGVLHSFTESWEVAQELLSYGLYISFAGMLTYKKSDALREVAAKIPADRILVETDAPYLSPEPHRHLRPNEPGWVSYTATCLAKIRGVSLRELDEFTTQNALRLFSRMT